MSTTPRLKPKGFPSFNNMNYYLIYFKYLVGMFIVGVGIVISSILVSRLNLWESLFGLLFFVINFYYFFDFLGCLLQEMYQKSLDDFEKKKNDYQG